MNAEERIEELKRSERIYLTAEDIAPILGAHPQSIRNAAKSGTLGFKVSQVGKRILIPKNEFLKFWEI